MKKEKINRDKKFTNEENQALDQFVKGFLQIRKGDNSSIELPEEFSGIIINLIEQNSKIYPLVSKFFPLAPGRIMLGTDVTEAEFLKPEEAASAEDFAVNVYFEFKNGYKLVKAIFINNDLLNENPGQFQAMLIQQIAVAFAMGLDDAILNGQGSEQYQFQGIIPSIPLENRMAVQSNSLDALLIPINQIDSGKYNEEEIIAIVNRNTYYKKLIKLLINCANPNCLPQFIFSYAMEENKILYADFSKYTLIRRGGFSLEKSNNAKFPFDQTGYKGRMNFDGKPSRPQAFSLVTLE